MPENLEVAAKLVAYLAIVLAIGCAGAAWLAARPAFTPFAELQPRIASRLLPIAGAMLTATLVRAWAHTASTFGTEEAWTWENLRLIALESRWGEGWRLQALAAVLLAGAAALARAGRRPGVSREPRARLLWTLAALAVACTVPQTGHGAAEPYRWVLHGAHVVAAGLWAGTLLVVATLGGNERRAVPHLLRAFGALATPAVALVAVSGVWASALYVGGLANLFSTEYGRLLLTKGTAVALMAVLGAANWRLLRRGAGVVPLTVYLEAGLAVGVVVLTAWLTETAHP